MIDIRNGGGEPERIELFGHGGYYVSTIGLNEEVIKKYIQNQEEANRFGAE